MPWRRRDPASGPFLPRGVIELECEPSAIEDTVVGMSTSTQWKKSTRGRLAGTVRPSLFTSSPRLGTSGSWQIKTSDFADDGTPLHSSCGLVLSLNATCP